MPARAGSEYAEGRGGGGGLCVMSCILGGMDFTPFSLNLGKKGLLAVFCHSESF